MDSSWTGRCNNLRQSIYNLDDSTLIFPSVLLTYWNINTCYSDIRSPHVETSVLAETDLPSDAATMDATVVETTSRFRLATTAIIAIIRGALTFVRQRTGLWTTVWLDSNCFHSQEIIKWSTPNKRSVTLMNYLGSVHSIAPLRSLSAIRFFLAIETWIIYTKIINTFYQYLNTLPQTVQNTDDFNDCLISICPNNHSWLAVTYAICIMPSTSTVILNHANSNTVSKIENLHWMLHFCKSLYQWDKIISLENIHKK